MKKYLPVLSLVLTELIFLPFIVSAQTSNGDLALPVIEVSGNLSADATWSPDSVYVLKNTVTVPKSITLTIEPGTIVKAKAGGAGSLEVLGSLVARGTEERAIYFTSLLDDKIGDDSGRDGNTLGTAGDWGGIFFKPGSTGELDHIVVRYAGYAWSGSQSGIGNDGGTVNIKNSLITENNAHGIGQLEKGFLSIRDSVISKHLTGISASGIVVATANKFSLNSRYGIYASGGSLDLRDNSFVNNGKTVKVDTPVDFSHSGNTSADIAGRGFEINGVLVKDTIWHTSDLPFIVSRGALLWIPSNYTLTISPDSVIKFETSAHMIVEGRLAVAGTKTARVYLTSLQDDSIAGDTNGDGSASAPGTGSWPGIAFFSGSTGDISHSVIRYAGVYTGFGNGTGRASIFNLGSNILLKNVNFEENSTSDIYQSAGSLSATQINFSSGYYDFIFDGGKAEISQSAFYSTNAVDNRSVSAVVDARYNWWGDETGPTVSTNPSGIGKHIYGAVLYEPWLTSKPSEKALSAQNPVIIVPGIVGSYLVRTDLFLDNERWPNLLLMSLSPDDLYLNDLVLSSDGNSMRAISPTILLKNIGDFDFFNSLLNQFSEDQVVELFPYDWRLSVETSSMKLKEKIEEIKLKTGSDKLNLVAHSMGGLVVKEYLKLFGNDSIEKFIDIATPHTGSPKSFKALNYGDNFGFEKFGLSILNSERIKIISQNMPSVYELLPSASYISQNGSYLYDLDDLDENSVRGSLGYTDTKEFMKNTGRNASLVDRADTFHQSIDNLDPADYDVETYNIVGCGTETLGKIFVMNKEASGGTEYNISYMNGDGTVPLKSAEAIPAHKTYYLKNATHALMPSTSGVKELVVKILTATSTEDFNISPYSNLATTATGCNIPNGKIVSFHSPIDLHIYDSLGNHTGPNINGDIENNIPGVSYDIIDDNKFAFLPDGLNYTVKGEATTDGAFNARIETFTDGRVTETKYFNQVPITSTAEVTFNVGNVSSNSISVDVNGDGIFELQVPVSAVLDEAQSDDLTKPVTKLDIKGNKISENSYISSVQIALSATDDNAGVLKTEYSLDGGKTWVKYNKSFVINDRGGVKLMYRSTDKAGNIESIKSTIVNIIYPGNSGKKK